VLVASIIWLIYDLGFEPLIGFLSAVAAFLTSLIGQDRASPPPLSESLAERNRQAMIKRVSDSWIKGVLEQSLYQVARIELGLEEQPKAIQHPWNLIVQEQGDVPRSLPRGVRMSDVFDDMDQALLILGAPGAGKTTLLLELANDLLSRAENDTDHPIPVVFNLSSWAVQRKPLLEWLVDELNERYDVPRKVARAWVDTEAILPLLDGLDEVAEEQRIGCAEAINAYRQEHGLVSMAVCSRTQEFETLGIKLRLKGAVVIEALTRRQVSAYLEGAGVPLAGVREALADDETLYELLDTPLMLSVVAMVYTGEPAFGLQAAGTVEERRERLFAAYVEAMHERRGMEGRYARTQVDRWLAWLARQMSVHEQSVFLLERMQPDWLPRSAQRWMVSWVPAILSGLVSGPVFGLVNGLVVGLFGGEFGGLASGLAFGSFSGLIVGLVVGLVGGLAGGALKPAGKVHWSWSAARRGLALGLAFGLVVGLVYGLVFGLTGRLTGGLLVGLFVALVSGLAGGLIFGLIYGLLATPAGRLIVEPAETLRWSWPAARRGLVFGLVFGLAVGLVVGLAVELAIGLAIGLAVGLVGGLVGGLIFGWVTGELSERVVANQGMYGSARSALVSGLTAGLGVGLTVGPVAGLIMGQVVGPDGGLVSGLVFGLTVGPVVGLGMGLHKGGAACLRHLVLRCLLVRNDLAPWKYATFLNCAAERILLRKVGGGYIFIHRLLQDYFAELWEREYAEAGHAARMRGG
jgi:hypothetical protein